MTLQTPSDDRVKDTSEEWNLSLGDSRYDYPRSHALISWAGFCDWVQGRKVAEQRFLDSATREPVVLVFEDGAQAVIFSNITNDYEVTSYDVESAPGEPEVRVWEKKRKDVQP